MFLGVRNIENTGITTNLIKNIPKELLGKFSLSWNVGNEDESIEVVVLYGEAYEAVNDYVNKIGGVLDNLGYGFGIVTINIKDLIKLGLEELLEEPPIETYINCNDTSIYYASIE